MQISDKQYKRMVDKASNPSKLWLNMLKAYLIGGAICLVGQVIFEIFKSSGANDEATSAWTSITLIFISAIMTGTGLYPKIAKHGGAGTLVPITGFANAVVSPAVEFKREGFIMGVGAKIFTIAGPVILYGTAASVAYGIVYWVITTFIR